MATKQTNIRIEVELLAKYEALAKSSDRTTSYFYHKALESFDLIQDEPKPVASMPVKAKQFEPVDLEFAEWMLSLIVDTQPNFKKPNLESWAKTIRLMREKDNRTHHEMGVLWKWARLDSFWQGNILSASKFRDKYDQLSIQKERKGNPNGKQSLSERSQSATERALAQIEVGGDLLGSHDAPLRLQVDQ